MNRVALPLLIDAIRTTDYGDFVARDELTLRLRESAHSYESTTIPLGSRGTVQYSVNTAALMPFDIGYDLLPPLSLRVRQALRLDQPSLSPAIFRLAGRTFQQLWCQSPEGRRQSEYGCWSGKSPHLLPALPGAGGTGGRISASSTDAIDPTQPLPDVLNVKKNRSSAPGMNDDAEAMTTTSSRDVSGSSSASSGAASSGRLSSSSRTLPSSVGSLCDPSSSISAPDDAAHSASTDPETLAALSSAPSTLENEVFFFVGALFFRETSSVTAGGSAGGNRYRSKTAAKSGASPAIHTWTKTDYILAVNLCDLAVYLVYVAWHDNAALWEVTDRDCAEYAMDTVERERFKPQNDRNWARLPGFEEGTWPYNGRPVVAKVADNVNEWKLGDMSVLFIVGPALLPADSVPVLQRVGLEN
jgi:hypothetical protein